ncbi:MAG: hypothetical protein NXI22_24855 [bacterium]|nr:hypothetical protein [bacterium]
MIIPKFSTRWLLGATVGFAAVSLIASFAYQDNLWAIALLLGLISLAVSFLVFVVLFLAGWYAMLLVSIVVRRQQPATTGASPFRE